MKFKIRDAKDDEEVLELWLEMEGEDVAVKSRYEGKLARYEFRITSCGRWFKNSGGNLPDELK